MEFKEETFKQQKLNFQDLFLAFMAMYIIR
jgi:hypothetical protein